MTKFILSGGYYHKTPDGGKAFCEEIVRDIQSKPVKILDCLFGRPEDIWSQKVQDDQAFFMKHTQEVELEIASVDHLTDQIKNNDVIFFQGSRPEDIINILNTIPDWKSALENKVVVASSGGASMLCTYFGVGKTLRLGEGLGILPIKFIPHWKSDYGVGATIDWDTLYKDLFSYKEELNVVTLSDGEFKVFHIS